MPSDNNEIGEITDCEDVKKAVPRAKTDAEKNYVLKRAIDCGCVDDIPDDWGVN